MFGTHDRNSILRSLLTRLLSDSSLSGLLEDVWKHDAIEYDLQLKNFGIEMARTDSTIKTEYDKNVEMAAKDKEYLGSFHVLALAHVVRRPIIVYGEEWVKDKEGNPLCANEMRGVYLPFGLPPSKTNVVPLALCFTSLSGGGGGHFTSLITSKMRNLLPLADASGVELPVRYSKFLPDATRFNLLSSYLKVKRSRGTPPVMHCVYESSDLFMLPESEEIQRKFLETAASLHDEAEV